MTPSVRTGLTSIVAAFVGGFLTLLVSDRSEAQIQNRPPITVTPRISAPTSGSQFSYVKKPLMVNVVDFDPLPPDQSQGSLMSGFYNSGNAYVTVTPPDTPRLPESVDASFTIYGAHAEEPYVLMDESAGFIALGGSLYEYRGNNAFYNGSRIGIAYSKASRTVNLALCQTVSTLASLPNASRHNWRGPRAGVFLLHIDFFDHERKIWYYGDAPVRLYSGMAIHTTEKSIEALKKLFGRGG